MVLLFQIPKARGVEEVQTVSIGSPVSNRPAQHLSSTETFIIEKDLRVQVKEYSLWELL